MKRRLRRVVQEIIRRFGARQLVLQSVSFGLLLLGSSAAIAAGGGAPDLPPPEFLWIGEDKSGGHALPLAPWIVDFIVFVLLLVAVTKGPFKKLFQSRHDSIKVAVEEAAAAHRTAKPIISSSVRSSTALKMRLKALLPKQMSLVRMKSPALLKERRPTVSGLKPMQNVSSSKSS